MTLGIMRSHGVRSVDAECNDCRHEARILVDEAQRARLAREHKAPGRG